VFRWFLSLLVVTLLTQAMLAAGLTAWVKHEEQRDVLPSKMYSVRQVPPEPRLIPNPVDSPATGRVPPRGPMETLAVFRERENRELQKYGLEDREGMPALPANAVAAVTSQPAGGAGAGNALMLPMPSSPSGGTAEENRLR